MATVAVGTCPFGVAITPDGAFAYVANGSSNNVSVIATASNTVVATVAVGNFPADVAITPDGAFVYVTNQFGADVSVIATASNTVVATVPVGTFPTDVAITPDGAFVYVTNRFGVDDVSVIATASNTVVATVAVGTCPFGVAITPDGAFAYVANGSSNNVSVIATASNTVVATVPVGNFPTGVAITPDGAFVYVTNQSGADVSVIATASNTVVATVAVGNFPADVAITPDGAFAYVANGDTSAGVSVIATASNTVVALVAVGNAQAGITITPDGDFAYVTNNDVSVIATASNTVVATVPVGIDPRGIAITPNPSPVSITLTPVNPPITIPAAGGPFEYTVSVTNNTASVQTTQVWSMITLPTGEDVGPTVGPVNLTLGPGETINGTQILTVPGRAPAGTYTYTFNVGTFPTITDAIIDATDSFNFTKAVGPTLGKVASGDASDWVVLNAETGKPVNQADWGDAVTVEKTAVVPDEFVLEQNHPNPFNPSTTITFGIPEASEVTLAIYNLRGQLIQTLYSGVIAAGQHSVVWNGNDSRGAKVASGVYVYQLKSKDFVATKKLVFTK